MEQKEQKKPLKLKKSTKRSLFALGFLLIGLLLVLAGSSYAYLVATTKQQDQNVVKVGSLEINYTDNGSALNLQNAFPVSDEVGLASVGYTFQITNTGTLAMEYKIQILNDDAAIVSDGCSSNLLSLSNLRFSVNSKVPVTLGDLESNQYVIDTGVLAPGATKDYVVKMWIKEDSGNEILGTHYHGKVVVSGAQTDKDSSGASAPELVEGMIPVIYNESTQNWEKADTNMEWYNYSTQKWANAVTVSETSRPTYVSATPGTTISMNDIQTMWVWIPRYEYQYANLGTQYAGGTKTQPGEIKVNFIDVSKTISSDSSNYKIHPAFNFGGKEINGFWYGKFETSSSNPATGTNYGGGNTTTLDPYIKPNVTSWRNITVSNIFTVSQKLTQVGNIYGLSDSADSHVSKNSEWGAVAYLSQSKYGKYGNSNYSETDKEVYLNNYGEMANFSTLTGCSSGKGNANISVSCAYTYEIPISGTGASTTGTIYGVYDMNGGAWEVVMGNFNNTIGNAGFITMPNSKYYNLYTTNNSSTACDSGICYGDALSETAGWYGDSSTMVMANYPWVLRSGQFGSGSNAGVFTFVLSDGGISDSNSFRLTIVN